MDPANSPRASQELGSMYDYLAKIILLGPSGAGKSVSSSKPPLLHPHDKLTALLRSCVLHRFVKNECEPSIPPPTIHPSN